MTKEEAYEQARAALVHSDGSLRDIIHLAMETYASLQVAERDASKWVDVNDRLPENINAWQNDWILFTDGSTVRNGCYDYEDGFWHERYGGKYIDVASSKKDSIKGGHITHWMPLPSIPPPPHIID